MVSRYPRQVVGHLVSPDRSAQTIQKMVDEVPWVKRYCTDGYFGYLDVVFSGKHIYNPHNKKNTFTVEGVNANLRHYIPTLARRSRCFPRKLENLAAVLFVLFVLITALALKRLAFSPATQIPHPLFPFSISFNSPFGHSQMFFFLFF